MDQQKEFECLEVTEVNVYPFKEGPSLGRMKGLADVTLNGQLLIRGLRIMDGKDGIFVTYPIDPFFKGEVSKYVATPLKKELHENIQSRIVEEYRKSIG